ncbi:MAG: HDIG domain-containing protein [Clostridium sp.]|nr:HDIG domain-containing protein [Clostridium sp.]
MKMVDEKKFENSREKWRRSFLFTMVFIITYFIMLTAVAPSKYDLKVGDIAEVDIKAPRDIIDQDATKAKENEIIESVEKVYSLKGEVKLEATKSVTTFFTKLINLRSSEVSEKEKIETLKKIDTFTLTDSNYKTLLSITNEKATEMQWILLSALEKVYENNIRDESDEDIEAKTIDEAKVIANDVIETDEKVTEALKSAPKEYIKKSQIIVKEGEPITQSQIEVLTELGIIGDGVDKGYLFIYIVLAALVFLTLALQYLYMKKERLGLLLNTKVVLMIIILNIVSIIMARSLNFVSPFVIPLGCTALIMTLLLDYKLAVVINTLNLVFVAIITGFSPQVIVLGIVNIIVACTSIKKVNGRNEVLQATLYMVIASAIVTLATGLLVSNNFKMIVSEVTFSILGALLSGIFAIGFTPFLESAFKIVTNMKLLELSNPNSPLLKRLLMEAPGTYNHSLMVANLAEVAAEEVDANPILARIGSYYHDVGKLKRPIFFGENLMGRENPHNRIKPTLSAQIIISHAKDGLELAKEYKLPEIIQDIIIQHHGTTLVKYFYYTLKNSSDNPDEIKEEDFKYSGPIPSSKEATIIMLADSVEAAVRSIPMPTKEKIEEMVNNIFKDKLQSDQLINSDLTLRDIENIKKCFLKVLIGVYHQRVEYPKEK